jgi:hypothetical protein
VKPQIASTLILAAPQMIDPVSKMERSLQVLPMDMQPKSPPEQLKLQWMVLHTFESQLHSVGDLWLLATLPATPQHCLVRFLQPGHKRLFEKDPVVEAFEDCLEQDRKPWGFQLEHPTAGCQAVDFPVERKLLDPPWLSRNTSNRVSTAYLQPPEYLN